MNIAKKHKEEWISFELNPLKESSIGDLQVICNENKVYSYSEIVYDHIPVQGVFKEASIKCKELDVKINQENRLH